MDPSRRGPRGREFRSSATSSASTARMQTHAIARQWISDVRTTLERHGMGWTMWDYSGGFGVVTKSGGKTLPDETTLHALGLHFP